MPDLTAPVALLRCGFRNASTPDFPEPTTFLRNHMTEKAACDFFGVMSLDRRKILHVNVTKNPTAEWVAQ